MRNIIPTTQQITIDGTAESGAQIVTSLEEMIKAHVSSIDKLKVECRKLNEMIQDGYGNDPVYREHDETAKAAANVRAATKAQIMKQPAILQLSQKLKVLKTELKEKKFSLSDYLLEYQRQTEANQLELFPGEFVDIVNTATVVRQKSKK